MCRKLYTVCSLLTFFEFFKVCSLLHPKRQNPIAFCFLLERNFTMRRRPQSSSSSAPEPAATEKPSVNTPWVVQRPQRSPFVWLTLFAAIIYCSWGVYHYQFESLPVPLTADQAGKRGFAEFSALKHVKALTQLGPHPLGFDAITLAQQVLT